MHTATIEHTTSDASFSSYTLSQKLYAELSMVWTDSSQLGSTLRRVQKHSQRESSFEAARLRHRQRYIQLECDSINIAVHLLKFIVSERMQNAERTAGIECGKYEADS